MAKGSSWEREVARQISEWGTGRRNPPQLWRSVNSGGWAHGEDRHAGDLTPNGPWGEWFLSMFAIETKHGYEKDMDFWKLFSQSEPVLWGWWEKIYKEATDCGKCPILIVKRNYYPALIGFPIDFGVLLPRYVAIGGTIEGVALYHMSELFETREPIDFEYGYKEWTTSRASS